MNLHPMRGLKLLLIDDDETIRRSVLLYLRDKVGELAVASYQEFDAEAFPESRFDVVYLSHSPPGMDARSFLSRIRSARPETPVIIISDAIDTVTACSLRRMGATDIVTKPFSAPDIMASIGRLSLVLAAPQEAVQIISGHKRRRGPRKGGYPNEDSR